MFWKKELWRGDTYYEKHRIPGMIVTQSGSLLVYREARRTASDWAMMDILLQRSDDGGESFSEPLTLASGTALHPTVNNPVMMQDKTGRIHFLYCEDYATNGGHVLQRTSDDDGISWSEPRDITHFTAPSERTCFALGPGHGICLSNGTLLIPVWLVPKHFNMPKTKHSPSVVSTLISTNGGECWRLGEQIRSSENIVNPNETSAAQLSDGSVYLNIRTQAGYRATAVSRDGYRDWQNIALDCTLPDARCFGSLTVIGTKNGTRVLLFVNCANNEARNRVTVHVSLDDGKTWCNHKLLDEERGGYAEIAADEQSGFVYILYEEDYGTKCHLVKTDLDFLIN